MCESLQRDVGGGGAQPAPDAPRAKVEKILEDVLWLFIFQLSCSQIVLPMIKTPFFFVRIVSKTSFLLKLKETQRPTAWSKSHRFQTSIFAF